MQKLIYISLVCLLAFSSCKEEVIENVVYDNVIHDLDTIPVYSSSIEKNRQKTNDQYIAILYADIFNQSISTNRQNDLSQLITANGDKQLINQLILSQFLNEPGTDIPTDNEMRQDIDKFIDEAYFRFFLRRPTEYERFFLKDAIENDPDMTPDLVYSAFALSDEYLFY